MTTVTPETQPEPTIPTEGEERELCPNCLTGNVPGATFCSQCGGPLSAYAAIGPFERIFAEGHIYRKATQQPHRLIVVLGIWLIFGPVAFIAASIALSTWQAHTVPQQLFMLGMVIVCVTLISKTTINYVARNRSARNSAE